jgi:hypothetical protein
MYLLAVGGLTGPGDIGMDPVRVVSYLRSRVILNSTTGTDNHEVQLVQILDLEDAYESLVSAAGADSRSGGRL